MKKAPISVLLLIISCVSSQAQVSLEAVRVGTSNDGALVVYGTSTMNNNRRIPYERITGSAFWKDDYFPATLYTPNNLVAGKVPVKINLYTNEIYYMTKTGEEMVISSDKLGKVEFHGPDSLHPTAVFVNAVNGAREVNPYAEGPAFVQLLNNGDVQLLKHTIVMLNTGDSAFGTAKRYYFTNQVQYIVSNKYGQTSRMRKLSKERVLETLNIGPEAEEWIRKNNINFKKETEVLKFFEYLNSSKK